MMCLGPKKVLIVTFNPLIITSNNISHFLVPHGLMVIAS